MMRVVIDTNVFVSAVLGGVLASVFDHWQRGRFTLIVTVEIVREYVEVLRRPKFALPADVVDSIASYLLHRAEFVTSTEHLSVVEADSKDDKFLEAAIAGQATLIVSGDNHLLALKTYRHVPIIAAREFLNRLELQTG